MIWWARRGAVIGLLGLALGCAGRQRQAGQVGARPTASAPAAPLANPVEVYRQMGLLAAGGALPFVGRVAFLASRSPDSTFMLLAISLANRVLTFTRDGDRFQAGYGVDLTVRQDGRVVQRADVREAVRVPSFKETARSDESVIFQQVLALTPGAYELSLTVRDEGSARATGLEAVAVVPRRGAGALSTPMPVYSGVARAALESLPHLVPAPRGVALFGQDSVIAVYVESYPGGRARRDESASASVPLSLVVRGGDRASAVFWSDTVRLPRRGALYAGIVHVPVGRIGVGPATLVIARGDVPDSAGAPLFVAFGEDLPVASFAEMLAYLRYFAAPRRLEALRDAPPERRAAAWAAFLRATDPDPATPQHEGLRAYFDRIAQANARFREEGTPGWLTDRGRVFVALGTPDEVYEPTSIDLNQRGRVQTWEYRRHGVQIVFVDQTGFGRWRMTLASESEFESLVRRVLAGPGG